MSKILRQYHGINHEVWYVVRTDEGLVYHIDRRNYRWDMDNKDKNIWAKLKYEQL